MKPTSISMETKIIQEGQSESFLFEEEGTLTIGPKGLMIKYLENNQIPVRVVAKDKMIQLTRGVDSQNFSKLNFIENVKTKAEYISDGRKLDLEIETKKIIVQEIADDHEQIIVEYDLYTGLYLVGNYMFKLIFTK